MTITFKDEQGIAGMRIAGKLASEVLDYLTPHVQPGVTTNALDKLAFDYITQVQQAIPAPLNYNPSGRNPYPKSICTSINHQVCHGIPSDKALKKGDIVNIDITVIKDGWHGDTSRMFIVGEGSIAAKRLCQLTYDAMWHGIVKVKPGARLGDIGHAIQVFAEGMGFLGVLSGPLVRSSYRAGRLWAQSMMKRGDIIPEHLQHLAEAAAKDGFSQAVK